MKFRPWLVIIALTLAVFAINVLASPDVVVWLGYLLPLFIAAKNFPKNKVYLLAAALSSLLILGTFLRH
ncbi:MAG: hypothetical protein ACYDFU_08285, partial [Nitrospirota bacterium]